jgi:hypothetical protein
MTRILRCPKLLDIQVRDQAEEAKLINRAFAKSAET